MNAEQSADYVLRVDYEAMLAAVTKEAEMWRTAKDRLAVRLNEAEAEIRRLRAQIDGS